MSTAPAAPRPAATTILLRSGAPMEVFLVKRNAAQRFMGGSHVFPGGRVDDGDFSVVDAGLVELPDAHSLAARMGLPPRDAQAYVVAAARELLEEAGVLLCKGAKTDDVEAVRKALLDGTTFLAALQERRLAVDGGALAYLAHWVTPVVEPKRFSARFFVAALPEGQDPQVDQNEAVAGEWFEPRNAVAAHLAREIVLPPPTLCVLDALAREPSLESALKGAPGEVPPIEPVFISDGDRAILAFPNDPLHSARFPLPAGTPTRVELRDGVWIPLVMKRDDIS